MLTITANSQSTTSGQALPAFTASYSGFKNGDTAAGLSTPATLSTTATSSSPAGSYPISASGATSSNYTITFVSGTLTVSPAPATVQSIKVQKVKLSKKKTALAIVVQFSEALNQTAAQNINNYTLATIPAKKKQKSKPFPLASAKYDATALTVTLFTRKALVLSPPLKLTITAAGLLDGAQSSAERQCRVDGDEGRRLDRTRGAAGTGERVVGARGGCGACGGVAAWRLGARG